jgi:hypothetical protein
MNIPPEHITLTDKHLRELLRRDFPRTYRADEDWGATLLVLGSTLFWCTAAALFFSRG